MEGRCLDVSESTATSSWSQNQSARSKSRCLEHSLILRSRRHPACTQDLHDRIWSQTSSSSSQNLSSYLSPLYSRSNILFPRHLDVRSLFLENLCCLRCNRELESGQKSVAVYVFAQTVGVRPRQKSAARRICFCPQCSVSLAMGPPPEGALNLAAWEMIRELVSSDPALTAAAWESLRAIDGFLPANGADGVPRRAVGGYLEF